MSTSLQLAEAQVALLTAEAAADDAEAAVASMQAAIAERLRRARNAEVRESAAHRRRASAAAALTKTSASRKTDLTNSEGGGSSAGADAGGCNTGIDSAASGGGGGGGTAAAVAELETKVREMHSRVSETDARLSRLCDEAEEMDAMCASLEGEIAVARAAVEQNRKSQRGSPATVKGSGLRRAQSLADEMSAHSASSSSSSQVNTRGERFVAVEGVVTTESESDSRVGVDGHHDAVQLRAEIQDLARELGCDVASVPRRQEDVENT
jgi:uncharacterized protein YdcH (DUF465 family)